jgi:serine phosphatase RsbU (regulator of sigma subunit)
MNYKTRYFIYGAIFGCFFPVISSIVDLLVQGLPFSFESILQVQKTQPLHWVIDSAPLFLGVFAMLAGIKQDEVMQMNQNLEMKVMERTRDLHEKNSELSIAQKDLSKSLEKISQSIDYAQRIQMALISNAEQMKTDFPGSFFLFRPRDVVSGDFLWYHRSNGYVYVAAVDCTGHGVPGAFMSLIGYCLLNKITSENKHAGTAEILDTIHIEIQKILNQKRDSEVHDGMEMALCRIDTKNKTIDFSGAGMGMCYISANGDMREIKADFFSLGGFHFKPNFKYTTQTISYQAGDRFYMFSDGITDQFNDKDEKFGLTRLRNNMVINYTKPAVEQEKAFSAEIDSWKKSTRQLDDMMLAGIAL